MTATTVSPSAELIEHVDRALVQVQGMSEAAMLLVDELQDAVAGERRVHALLNAIKACLTTIDGAVDPIIERDDHVRRMSGGAVRA